jgi:hypothetical protein
LRVFRQVSPLILKSPAADVPAGLFVGVSHCKPDSGWHHLRQLVDAGLSGDAMVKAIERIGWQTHPQAGQEIEDPVLQATGARCHGNCGAGAS